MGSSSSKLRKHLQHGDEYAALQLYNNNGDLRKALDPNLSYGDNHAHDTPLHLAGKHGMKALLRIFLFRHGGNPNKKNGRNETALHNVCMTSSGRNLAMQQRRADCLTLILQWTGATLEDGTVERADLGAMDEKENTALHYAAASGLKRCVELLVSHNAPLFTENLQKQTPCDCAEKNGHSDIALYLESKMVFSGEDEEPDNLEMETILDQLESEEAYSGLRAQDLQEAKDQLLVETSDMLRVPLFTAEALLRNHEWSRETLLEAWMDDPIACCDKCGVVPPASVCDDSAIMTLRSTTRRPEAEHAHHGGLDHELTTPIPELNAELELEIICDICACVMTCNEGAVSMTCDHQFCKACWQRYLTGKITEGDIHNITCPGYNCTKLVPVDVIETLVPRDMARRYLQFDIKAFVDSNPSIKWCPYPGCGRAVRLPESDNPLSPSFRGMYDPNITNDFSRAVDCGNGHIFCWECLGEAHEPASCDNWKKWYQKIAEIRPEQLNGTEEECEIAANCLWLVTNSKNCPNCKSPIQKNEGCNHMKCSKCKHDFCWVCLEPWKRHSSTTGGYFRCNRYEVVKKVQEGQESLKSEAEEKNKKMQELNRFVHYYSRFKNHENSFKLEEPLVTTAKEKMMVLARAVTDQDTANAETQFVKDAVHHLLKGRRVLKCSYAYGFYLAETGYKKPIFEFMQTELEECTETLSEMVARPYLRTPRSKIIQAAALVHRKRQELLTAISKGLVPTDTSPTLRKKKGRYTKELDEDLKKALMESLSDIDPANPWVKDSTGKHTNVSALLDWPEEEDESENESETMESTDLPSGGSDEVPELCEREGCRKPRAKNPRTGEEHNHCSITCMQAARRKEKDASPPREVFVDYQMDLLRALEMSRLQFLREMGQLRPGSSSSDKSPSSPRPVSESGDQGTTSISSLILQDASLAPNPNSTPSYPQHPTVDSSASNTTPKQLNLPTIPTLKPSTSYATKDVSPASGLKSARELSLIAESSGRDHKTLSGSRESRSNERGDRKRREKSSGKTAVEHTDVSLSTPTTSVSPVRRGRVLSEPGHRPSLSNRTDDADLARAMELSRLSLQEEERDLRLAIELSLKDSVSNENSDNNIATPSSQDNRPTASSKNQSKSEEQIQTNPDYSSIVMRVPNRSVEDLAENDGVETLGACGGVPLSPQPPKARLLVSNNSKITAANPFGLLKDISVTNINIGTEDKTKAFEDKRFAFMSESSHQYLNTKNESISSTGEQPRFDSREPRVDNCDVDEILVIEEHSLPTTAPEVKNVLYLTKRQNHEINNVSEQSVEVQKPGKKVQLAAPTAKPFVINPTLNNASKQQDKQSDDLDPSDFHCAPDFLESMIQGAEGYQRNVLKPEEENDDEVETRARDQDFVDETNPNAEHVLLLERIPSSRMRNDGHDGDEENEEESAVFV